MSDLSEGQQQLQVQVLTEHNFNTGGLVDCHTTFSDMYGQTLL